MTLPHSHHTREAEADTQQFRPSFHFTPAAHWMNDPNGMVHHRGVWHLFFQYHPHSAVWGPMHWGHATSSDLMHWQEQPIALQPDALGMIFSGSAVVDADDTAGFARAAGVPAVPLVAVFTHHGERQSADDVTHEKQSLACSLDDGLTWTPYAGNPVLRNPGALDFRDPKVRWLPDRERWLMVLAVGDHVAFYTSPDLKDWTHESDFGAGQGAHDGVWECPDLFPLQCEGRTHWVLLVSLVEGGPNGGSATQYFVGDFDGHRFTAPPGPTRWLDHGPDNYAGVTWSNAPGGRTVFMGWMSNWTYARQVPTSPWRSAMTLPRELQLRFVEGQWRVASLPAAEVRAAEGPAMAIDPSQPLDAALTDALRLTGGRLAMHLHARQADGFVLTLGNEAGDQLRLGFAADEQRFFIDRRQAGQVDFQPAFADRHGVPRVATPSGLDLTIYLDACSVELFADGGLSVLTSLVFPRAPWATMRFEAGDGLALDRLTVHAMPAPERRA